MPKPQNYDTIRYGNKDGELKFGHITENNEIDSFIVRSGYEPNHYIEMCSTGDAHRKNGTICRSTGTFHFKAGDKVKSGKSVTGVPSTGKPPENCGIFFESVDGDLWLGAPNAKVKIWARDIELIATGYNGSTGSITLSANEKVNIEAPYVHINGKTSTKIVSDDTVNVLGKTILNIYGGLIDIADGASTAKAAGPKAGSKPCLGNTYVNELRQYIEDFLI
jgi:hypothetical protein